MNRLKLFSLLIVLTVVGILLGQNRESLFLKFFCPDITNQSCLYRTPNLPLAAWMTLFVSAGIISSLVWQFFNQLAIPPQKTTQSDNSRSGKNKVYNRQQVEYTRPQTAVNVPGTSVSDWEEPRSEDWETDNIPQANQDRVEERLESQTNERVSREPQDRMHNDTAYSYKFREAKKQSGAEQSDRENNKADDVYDATYRTVASPQSGVAKENEEDEEWI